MGCVADLLANVPPVRHQVPRRDTEHLQDRRRCQIQDSIESVLVLEEFSGEQPYLAGGMLGAHSLKFCDYALGREAEVEARKTLRRVVTAASNSCSFAAQGIERWSLVSESQSLNGYQVYRPQPGRFELIAQAVTPSASARIAPTTRRYCPWAMSSSGFS